MSWVEYTYVAIFTIAVFIGGSILLFIPKKQKWGEWLILAGIAAMAIFIISFWMFLTRPPLRTLGETRLWYTFFISLAGFITYKRWKQRWISAYSNAFAILFILLNLFNPEAHDKTLMPALQSPFFPPHVIVYLLGYSISGASSLVAIRGLMLYFKKTNDDKIKNLLPLADTLVYTGFSFLTFGLLLGALWAKEAWGHYWSWDPKETWALITWLAYLLYIHVRQSRAENYKLAFQILAFAFILLLVAWFGVNYLPA
ncbi:MAG: cytochrome c biogenesis protein CcsA, partial [Bacteroidales bacterium]|nr:cytochrome c biogenesis protein CcsA [Bacteroidales bacterium]